MLKTFIVGAGPSAAAPRAPLMLASGWGPLAPARRCASLGPRLLVSPGAGRRAEFRSPSRRFCPWCKAARPPREVSTLPALRTHREGGQPDASISGAQPRWGPRQH